VDRAWRPQDQPTYSVGLVQLFTALSTGKINVNTAPASTLQIIPGMDENSAAQVIKQRSGPDGVDGTEDDTPFRNVGELVMAVSNPQLMQQLSRYCDVRSRTFEIQVEARIGDDKRIFHAILGRNSPRDVQVLSFYWD
jgi:type II secretory pathway component PulK